MATVKPPPLGYGFIRVTLGGTITSQQSWSTGFSVGPVGGGVVQVDLQTWLSNIQTILTNCWTAQNGPRTLCAPDTVLSQLRAYYTPANSYLAAAVAAINLTPMPGTGTTTSGTQSALVASLRTARAGRSGKGRMYWPATGVGLAQHQIALTNAQGVATAVATMLQQCKGFTAPGTASTTPVVPSMGTAPTPITQVTVDTKLDVQRRRANKTPAISVATAAVA